MSLFEPVPIYPATQTTVRKINETFDQPPEYVPLTIQPPTVRYVPINTQNNALPIIAIVGMFSFFGLLAFLAFMKR
jgi:hypothetical protein